MLTHTINNSIVVFLCDNVQLEHAKPNSLPYLLHSTVISLDNLTYS